VFLMSEVPLYPTSFKRVGYSSSEGSKFSGLATAILAPISASIGLTDDPQVAMQGFTLS